MAVLGDTAAASLGKKPGDELELLGETFRVVGIANYTTIVKTEWPVLNLRVAYFGQYRKPGAGPFPSVLMMNGPF